MCDNGPKFTCKAMFFRAQEVGVRLCFIQLGKPTRNARVESFHGRMRDGCLNQHCFADLRREVRLLVEQWHIHYNTERPHSSLRYEAPERFASRAVA